MKSFFAPLALMFAFVPALALAEPAPQDGGQEQEQAAASPEEKQESPKPRPKNQFNGLLTVVAAYNADSEGTDISIPYLFPMLGARYMHHFAEHPNGQQFDFTAQGTLSALWLDGTAELAYSPFPFLTLSAGGAAGTSWNLSLGDTDVTSLALYNPDSVEYDRLTPFKHWYYEAYVQGAVRFDIRRLTFAGSYRARYAALTGVHNGDVWKYKFQGEQVNGFKYTAAASVSYRVSAPFVRSLSVTGTCLGYYSSSYFDDRYENYDKTFATITIAPAITAGIGRSNIFVLSSPITAKRNFIGNNSDKDDEPLLKSDGRTWKWGGIMLSFTHIF